MGEQSFSRRFKKGIREWISVIPFLLIGTVLFILFVLYPQIKNIYISFTNYSIMPGADNRFVGLENLYRYTRKRLRCLLFLDGISKQYPCHTDYRARTADFRTLGCGLHP